MSQNRMLTKILGPKWEEITGGWRKLHNKQHHDLYCEQNILKVVKKVKEDEMGGTCGTYGGQEQIHTRFW